jgi:uncharacterized protein (DUF983 family)
MFSRFLKVADRCPVCGEELFHQRADDFPAYLVIVLVGHTIVPLALLVETEYAPALWLQMALWVPLTALLSLALLQPINGAVVAMPAPVPPTRTVIALGTVRGRRPCCYL